MDNNQNNTTPRSTKPEDNTKAPRKVELKRAPEKRAELPRRKLFTTEQTQIKLNLGRDR